MRSNKGLGRKRARTLRLLQELRATEIGQTKRWSIYHVRLAHKFARSPDFRKPSTHVVVTTASVNELKRERQETKDFKAGRNGQKESRLSVRAAHRRKVKAERRLDKTRICFCPACKKGNK